MKNAVVLLFLLLSAFAAATQYDFGDFEISTEEELWLGAKYSGYPVHYLFDGSAQTPWVFKGLKNSEAYKSEQGYSELSPYTLILNFKKDRRVDRIRLIPGYAKDAATWKRNNRIKRLKIWAGYAKDNLLADVQLKDEMRWHEVKFRSTMTQWIVLEPVEFYTSPDDDVCISELEFYGAGKKMRFDASRMALLNAGGGCCCDQRYYAVNQHGTRLMKFDTGEGYPNAVVTDDGRFLAGTQVSSNGSIGVFVFDANTSKLAATKFVKRKSPEDLNLVWKGYRLYDEFPLEPLKLLLKLSKGPFAK